MKEGANPGRWANEYPWATAGTAFGVGLAAGYIAMPGRGSGAVHSHDASRDAAAVAAGAAEQVPPGVTADSSSPFRDKLAAGAKSMILAAAYGLGRLALNQVLDGFLAGTHSSVDPADPGPEYSTGHAESFSWQPETPT